MPTKTYKYQVTIGVGVGTRDLSKGTAEVENHLSRWEKRAIKAVKSIEKAMAELVRVEEKVFSDNSRRSGGTSGKWTDEHKAVLKATQLINRYDLSLDKLAGKQTELKKLNHELAQPGVAGAINETTKALLRQKAATVDQIKATRELEKTNAKNVREQRAQSNRRINSAQNVGGGLQSVGVTATAIVTSPIVAGFYSAIKAGAEYEASMNLMQAVTSATADEMSRADDLAIKLGNDLSLPGVSAKDAAEAMTELGKAGFTASQAMDAAKGTLQLSTAANISAAEAAEITANALNMFQLEASEAGRVADLLAGAANASSAEITDVATSLQQAGSVFAAAGVPIEDVVALISEMANQGIKGSDAGTSLKTMMQRLQSPSTAAAAALQKLNIAVYDQQGKMKPMREIIGQFETSLKGLTQQQKDQALNTIFGADAVRAANIVIGQGTAGFDKMKESVMRLNAAQELAAARTKGLGGAWEALKSQAETVGLIIYNRIKEPLTNLVIFVGEFVSQITGAFINLPEGVQQAIIAFVALLAAIGPVLAIIGTLVVGLGSVAGGLTALTGAATVGAALAALVPVITTVAAVVGTLAAGITFAVGVVYTLARAWDEGWGTIASAVAIHVAAILSVFAPVLALPVTIGIVAVTIYKMWETNFGGLRDFVTEIWNEISQIISAALGRIVELVNLLGGKFLDWWQRNLPLMQEITVKVSASIQETIARFLTIITGFWTAHGEKIMATVNFIWNTVKTVILTVFDYISGFITLTLQVINGNWSEAWDTMLSYSQKAVKNIVQIADWLNKMMVAALIVFLEASWKYGNMIALALIKAIGAGLIWIVNAFINLPNLIIKLVPRLVAAGMQIGTAIWEGIKEGLSSGGGAVGGASADLPGVPFDITKIFSGGGGGAVGSAGLGGSVTNLNNNLDSLNETVGNTNKSFGDLNKNSRSGGGGNKSRRTDSDLSKEIDDNTLRNFNSAVRRMPDELRQQITEFANRYRIPTEIALAQIYSESTFNPGAKSPFNKNVGSSAYGLTQQLPATASRMLKRNVTGRELQTNTKTSLTAWGEYMTFLFNRYGDWDLAVLAYHQGEGTVDKYVKAVKAGKSGFLGKKGKAYLAKIRGLSGVSGDQRFNYDKGLDFDRNADESSLNNAKQRVQELVNLSRELNVALTVPLDVTTTNDALIQQQKTELKNLQDLKKKREDILETVSRLGLKQEDFARSDLAQATASLDRLNAIEDGQKLVNQTYENAVKKLEEMKAATDGALTPLQDFNLQFERLWKASGLAREEFERLNPKLVETRQKLQEIADLELSKKVTEQIKQLGKDITEEIERINRETAKVRKTDREKQLLDRRGEVDDYITKNQIPEARRGEVEQLFERRNRALDAQAAAEKAATATQLYTDKVKELNEAMRGNVQLTAAQRLEIDLTSGSLKDLTEEQKNSLRVLQEQADVQEKINQYNDKIRAIGTEFGSVFANSFNALFTKGFKGALETLQSGLKNFFKNLWLNIVNQFAQKIQQSIADRIFSVFGLGGNNSGQRTGGLFGIGSGSTPPFNQGVIPNLTGGNRQVIPGNFVNYGNSIPSLGNNVDARALGGAMQSINFGGHSTTSHSTHSGAAPRSSGFSLNNIFGKGGIFGSKGFGFNSGTISGLGAVGGIAGSFIGGGAGSALTGAATGIGLASSLSSLLGISALGGPVGLAIGAAIGGLLGIGSFLFGKSKQRRADEKTRNSVMVDALGALDKLIADVGADKIDGDQAISQAEDIRKNYLDQMSQLKDSKTRRIALADVSRLDSKITALKAAATGQQQRKDKLTLLAPTFADGGAVSNFANANYRHNPLGYIQGPGTSRSDSINAYFPVADQFARISNREYVLDAETTAGVGIERLDRLRANRGRNFNTLFRHQSNTYADGGAVGLSNLSNNQNSGGNSGNIELKAETKVYITQDGNGNITSVSTETILDTPQGKQKLEQTVADIIYENRGSGKIPTALNRVNRGQS